MLWVIRYTNKRKTEELMTRFFKAALLSLALFAGIATTAPAANAVEKSPVLDISTLSEEQQLTLRKSMLDMKKQAAEATPVETVKKISEWASLGQQFGAGLAQTAKELGIAANEFVNTPVGKLVAAIIVWKLMGGALVHIVAGVAFFIVAMSFWWVNWKRMCLIKTEKDVEGKHFFGLCSNKEYTYYEPGDVDGTRGAMLAIVTCIVLITITILFTF